MALSILAVDGKICHPAEQKKGGRGGGKKKGEPSKFEVNSQRYCYASHYSQTWQVLENVSQIDLSNAGMLLLLMRALAAAGVSCIIRKKSSKECPSPLISAPLWMGSLPQPLAFKCGKASCIQKSCPHPQPSPWKSVSLFPPNKRRLCFVGSGWVSQSSPLVCPILKVALYAIVARGMLGRKRAKLTQAKRQFKDGVK